MKTMTNTRVYDIQYYILEDSSAGIAIFKTEEDDYKRYGESTQETFAIPIVSIWIDPSYNNAIKVLCAVNAGHANYEEAIAFSRLVSEEGRMPYKRSTEVTATVSSDSSIVRVGPGANDHYEETYPGEWSNHYKAYDSKADAISAIIAKIGHRKSIGGLNLINLNKADDEVLESVGFVKVEDKVGEGVPMWLGNPSAVLNAGASHSYSYTANMKNIDSFLEILNESLSTVK